jgi:hypothetical protein
MKWLPSLGWLRIQFIDGLKNKSYSLLVPRKQQKYVEAWVALREDEIGTSLKALNENSEVIKIKGLEG